MEPPQPLPHANIGKTASKRLARRQKESSKTRVSMIPEKHPGKILESDIKFLESKEFPGKQRVLPTKNPRKF